MQQYANKQLNAVTTVRHASKQQTLINKEMQCTQMKDAGYFRSELNCFQTLQTEKSTNCHALRQAYATTVSGATCTF